MTLIEPIVKGVTLAWFGQLGFTIGHGHQLALSESTAERAAIKRYLPVRFARRLNP